VRANVCLQGGGPVEGLVAYVAFVGFLGCVDNFMSTERARQTKSLAAYGTNKRLGSSVRWHFQMNCQCVLCLEDLAALITFVWRLAVRDT